LVGFYINRFLLCSNCFRDFGLRTDALRIGFHGFSKCPKCRTRDGKKLGLNELNMLLNDFFVHGSHFKAEYGRAPLIQFNHLQETNVTFSGSLNDDARLISETLGIGFFHYGPRAWMFGHITPLQDLQNLDTRPSIVNRILEAYPADSLSPGDLIYRLRTNVAEPDNPSEYDGQPLELAGRWRLDSPGFPILYGSQDIKVCIHECRASAEDEIFVGTLSPTRQLNLLNLSHILDEGEGVTEFESLDLAVYMLFLAGDHSYEICREIAKAAKQRGFDGAIYPSYYSMIRTGSVPFETVYGLSHRRFVKARNYETKKIIRNLALFGRPVASGDLEVKCINSLTIRRADYDIRFGPARFS